MRSVFSRAAFPVRAVVALALSTIGCATNGAGGDAGTGADAAGGAGGASVTDGSSTTPPGAIDSGGDSSSPTQSTVDASPPAILAGLHIDISQTSVSGISSGGFMAVQFGVAFSSIIEGIGVFAGGPFDCSQGSLSNAEGQCANASTAPDVTPMVSMTKSLATSGAIDDTSHLASARIFLFGGADDLVVSPSVVDATQTYFEAFMASTSIQYVSRRPGTGHTMPTLAYGGSCDSSAAPWIGDCGYDGAGTALAQIYGTLAPASPTAGGTVTTLAQGDFVADPASHSLDANAFVYVPASCAAGETCRIHVAFHGCEMQVSGVIGSAFYLHAGYDEWADTNHIVVLYPQLITTTANPYACWDFWGYDSAEFDTKSAPQMAMTRAMIAFLAGAAGDAGGD